MKIMTYWWGAELFPDNDEEWKVMVDLFSEANLNDLGGYDRCKGEDMPRIFDGAVDEHVETVTYKNGHVGRYEKTPCFKDAGLRCITIYR